MREFKAVEAKELITEHPKFEGAIEYIEEYSQSDYTDSSHFLVSTLEDALESAIEDDDVVVVKFLEELQQFLQEQGITLIFWDN